MAMGDSYTAGPGAGDRYPSEISAECYQTTGSYAAQLEADFPFDTENKFTFLACSGYTTQDVIDKQLSKIPDDHPQDWTVMTLGGNDALFSRIIQICLLGLGGPGTRCESVIDQAEEEVGKPEFRVRLHKIYDG
jgi:lysophospholipase L1-like esterase